MGGGIFFMGNGGPEFWQSGKKGEAESGKVGKEVRESGDVEIF